MALSPGDIIADKLRLERLLGRGGMGSVWVAEHLGLKARVAVKFLEAENAQHPEAVARFEREATSAAQLRSPHVVQVFDHGTANGHPYLVMELLEGEDLAKRLERTGPLAPADLVEVVNQVSKALARAHAQGIVHRDIKPDNIFLIDQEDDELVVKVLDFGIAKQSAAPGAMNLTRTGSTLGTPYYMSPEQVLGAQEVDHRSDLWSLAVVAYEALTGVVPFSGPSIGAIGIKIHEAVFEPASRLRSELDPKVDDWFARALSRDPAARFSSARELAQELGVALGPTFPSLLRHAGFETIVTENGVAAAARKQHAAKSASLPPASQERLHSGTLMTSTASPERPARRLRGWVLAAGALFGAAAIATVTLVALVGAEHADPSRDPAGPNATGVAVDEPDSELSPPSQPIAEAPASATSSAAPVDSPRANPPAAREPRTGSAPPAPSAARGSSRSSAAQAPAGSGSVADEYGF